MDNNSTDDTRRIAKKNTVNVLNKGHERSAQRNYGAKKSKGNFLLFIDSDMELTPKVVKECVKKILSEDDLSALIIPEKSVGVGFWAECKALERSFYLGVDWIEAARFFDKKVFTQLKGYDEALVSGEDWDLSNRITTTEKIGRVESFILHNEGEITLIESIKKKYYYAQKFSKYLQKNQKEVKVKSQIRIWPRYKLFFSAPKKLFQNPVISIGMLFMKSCEFGFGGVGYLQSKFK